MKVVYRQAASDDVVRQFRYYLVDQNVPEIATRFTEALQRTIEKLREHPLVGARCRLGKPELENLRSWPVAGFESIRIYYLAYHDAIQVIRVLHGKRDLKRILERESST